MTASTADVRVTGGGSVYVFMLLSPEARAWVEENVSADRMMLGPSLAVEWRFAAALAEGMEADGLVLTDGEVPT